MRTHCDSVCTQEYTSLACTECSGPICTFHASNIALVRQVCDGCMNDSFSDSEGDGCMNDNFSDSDMEVEDEFYDYAPQKPKTTLVSDADGTCSICLEDLSGPARKTACNHVFHAACISGWFKKASTCPLCRK